MSYIKKSYDILTEVYLKDAYLNVTLAKMLEDGDSEKDKVVKIVYGVLENNVSYDYCISALCTKSPKNSIKILLKIGMYCIDYMDSLPDYAVINNCVEFAKTLKQQTVAGFTNAVLKKYAIKNFDIKRVLVSKEDELAYKYNKPLWLVKKYMKEYPNDYKLKLDTKKALQEHIRVNTNKMTLSDLKYSLRERNTEFLETKYGGMFVKYNDFVKYLFNEGFVTIQSLSSMLVVKGIGLKKTDDMLDVCGAPGGKSVFASELTKGNVICLDVHPHRVQLIESYKHRMHSKIKSGVWDATKLYEKYIDKFDAVLCDCPCSGLGVTGKNPDILLRRKEKDIYEMAKVQKQILETSKNYVKVGGVLMYSTCTNVLEENSMVVKEFLKNNDNFKLEKIPLDIVNDGMIQLNEQKGYDGFFMARMVRKY